MGALLVPVIVAVIVAAVVLIGVREWAGRRERLTERLAAPDTSTLDYRVPAGQDPVTVLTALDLDGFTATGDPGDHQLVHVDCPAGPDRSRARVRAVIASVHTTSIDSGAPVDPGAVRFLDETPG